MCWICHKEQKIQESSFSQLSCLYCPLWLKSKFLVEPTDSVWLEVNGNADLYRFFKVTVEIK